MYFAVPTHHEVKTKKKMKAKYLDLTRQLKKPWKMNVMLMLIAVGAFGTVPKGLEKRLEKN